MSNEFVFPSDVPGWLEPIEGHALAEVARNRTVLEIGSYAGRSTICMAQTALAVHAVDHHQGDAGTGPADTLAAFTENINRYGVAGKVFPYVGRSTEVQLNGTLFDMAFIDGAHDELSVRTDLAVAMNRLKPGGVIAMHDWDYPAVQSAARMVFGRELLGETVGRTRFFKPSQPYVFVAVPSRGTLAPGVLTATHQMAQRTPVFTLATHGCSLLTMSFNQMWADALNARDKGITHFFMHHDDLWAEDKWWLDTMYDQLQASGADILSAVVPIKDERGLSSTALYHPPTNKIKRVTMTDAMNLPTTFTAADCGYPECVLLPNTGFWICDFTKPWVEEICFTIRDRIFKDPVDGLWKAQCFSEDWHFGIQAFKLGLRVCATTAVKIRHRGVYDYTNAEAWGTVKDDEAVGVFAPADEHNYMPEPVHDPD
jgi:hypothetical protein